MLLVTHEHRHRTVAAGRAPNLPCAHPLRPQKAAHLASNSCTTASSCPCRSTHEICLLLCDPRCGCPSGRDGLRMDLGSITRSPGPCCCDAAVAPLACCSSSCWCWCCCWGVCRWWPPWSWAAGAPPFSPLEAGGCSSIDVTPLAYDIRSCCSSALRAHANGRAASAAGGECACRVLRRRTQRQDTPAGTLSLYDSVPADCVWCRVGGGHDGGGR